MAENPQANFQANVSQVNEAQMGDSCVDEAQVDDASKTREQLIGELMELRQHVTQLNADVARYKYTEQALRTSEARFSRAFRSSPDAISIATLAEERFIDVNDSFLELFGYSRQDVVGRTATELNLWSESGECSIVGQLLLQQDGIFNLECACTTRLGETKILLVSSEIIHLDGQDCILTLSKDITERKQAELALKEAIAREQRAIQRERFIAKVAQTIRQSLNLHQVLSTTVEEVRQFLGVDRVVVYQFHADPFHPDWSGRVVAESVATPTLSLLNQDIYDPCFGTSMLLPYRQGQLHKINDVLNAELDPCYAELLIQLNIRAVLVIPILVRQELWGLLAAHQCSSARQWEELNWLLLQQLSTQLAIGIYQAELYQQIQQQAQREQALSQVIQDIRNSLDLNTIFATATSEIGRLLHLDRAAIAQYLPDERSWLNVASYCRSQSLSNVLGWRIPDDKNQLFARLKQGDLVQMSDSHGDVPPSCDEPSPDRPLSSSLDAINHITPRSPVPSSPTYPGSWLLVPLDVGDALWGSLNLNHEGQWNWHDWEVELARAVANQLAIAIQQSQLYIEIQDLNNELEHQVRLRTSQLHQALEFEALLKRITDKVRDSLDEEQILQTAVEELTQGLGLLGCDTALYDHDQQTSTICFECIRAELPQAKGRSIKFTNLPDLYHQLFRGQPAQFCHVRTVKGIARLPRYDFSMLACPMIDNRQVIGDVWLFKPPDSAFNSLEIRLVQQVANQCAIALRQSHLYQAAQAQVRELERLNQLKNDFLSTVSHELRTPMSSIKMATQMLEVLLFQNQDCSSEQTGLLSKPTIQQPATGMQRVHRYFQILRDECDREIRLINDLLDLSRLDAGTEPLILTTIAPNVWITHIAEPFISLARNQQQHLTFALADNIPQITTDLSDLERIFTELLNNACKYSPMGAHIAVLTQLVDADAREDSSPKFCLSVTNTGVEIPETEQERIFDNFYRIPNSDPWKYSGAGLGLALVKKLVQRLKGAIYVSSGTGQTVFTLHLPLHLGGKTT